MSSVVGDTRAYCLPQGRKSFSCYLQTANRFPCSRDGKCHAKEYSARFLGIISLAGKHLSVTFSVYSVKLSCLRPTPPPNTTASIATNMGLCNCDTGDSDLTFSAQKRRWECGTVALGDTWRQRTFWIWSSLGTAFVLVGSRHRAVGYNTRGRGSSFAFDTEIESNHF